MKRSQIVALSVFGAVCILAGNKTAGDPPPDVVTVTHTKYEHVPGATKTITVRTPLSPHCLQAIRDANSVALHSQKLYDNGDKQLDIFAQGRRLLAAGKNTTAADEAQQRLLGKEVGDIASTVDALTNIKLELKLCKESQ